MNASLFPIGNYQNHPVWGEKSNSKPNKACPERSRMGQFLYQQLGSSFIIPGLCKKSRYIKSAVMDRESNDEIREYD
jgi:hypothetical protein